MGNVNFDFREYRDLIRGKVKELNDRDKNWRWTVKAINKHEVRIGWGYLDYIHTNCFKIKIENMSDPLFDEEPWDVAVLRACGGHEVEGSLSEDFYHEFLQHESLEFLEIPFDKAIVNAIDHIGYAAFTRY